MSGWCEFKISLSDSKDEKILLRSSAVYQKMQNVLWEQGLKVWLDSQCMEFVTACQYKENFFAFIIWDWSKE